MFLCGMMYIFKLKKMLPSFQYRVATPDMLKIHDMNIIDTHATRLQNTYLKEKAQ